MQRIPDCYDPAVQFAHNDLAQTARLMRRPLCAGCGCRIVSETCLDLSPFGLKDYACERCIQNNTQYTDDLEEPE